jgi:ribosomal protein L15E
MHHCRKCDKDLPDKFFKVTSVKVKNETITHLSNVCVFCDNNKFENAARGRDENGTNNDELLNTKH